MKKILSPLFILTVFILFLGAQVLYAQKISRAFIYKRVTSQVVCEKKHGYWYKNYCWKDFDEELEIPADEIDSFVKEQIEIINKTKIIINRVNYIPDVTYLEEEKKATTLTQVIKNKKDVKTLIFSIPKNRFSRYIDVNLFDRDLINEDFDTLNSLEGHFEGHFDIDLFDQNDGSLIIDGSLTNEIEKVGFEYDGELFALSSSGNSTLKIKGDEAFLDGYLGSRSYMQIKDLITNHKNIKTLVLGNVPGSLDNNINTNTGRILHDAGLNTKVLVNSDIASGGVDLFTAGNKRIITKGAKIYVHSWCCTGKKNLDAAQLPKQHPSHQYPLEYFTMTLGPKIGPEFYSFILEIPFTSLTQMSEEELRRWNIGTEYISF